jgi:hypothetical protein
VQIRLDMEIKWLGLPETVYGLRQRDMMKRKFQGCCRGEWVYLGCSVYAGKGRPHVAECVRLGLSTSLY